jgi:enamine deaminase RidA (YjgF/YER057c/UK114 family)
MESNVIKPNVERVFSGTKWETDVAYCRALKYNGVVYVSGTTAVNEAGQIVGKGNLYEQTVFIFKKIDKALKQLNSDLSKVIRTRMYVVNIDDFDHVARAHKEIFTGVNPVATCVEITRLVDSDLLIEIEVEAAADEI